MASGHLVLSYVPFAPLFLLFFFLVFYCTIEESPPTAAEILHALDTTRGKSADLCSAIHGGTCV